MKALPAVRKLAEALAERTSVMQRVTKTTPNNLRVDIASRRLNSFKYDRIDGAGFIENN